MPTQKAGIELRESDRIRVDEEYELCAWARYFNASERRVKEAVAAVGDRALRVRDHLSRRTSSANPERPSA